MEEDDGRAAPPTSTPTSTTTTTTAVTAVAASASDATAMMVVDQPTTSTTPTPSISRNSSSSSSSSSSTGSSHGYLIAASVVGDEIVQPRKAKLAVYEAHFQNKSTAAATTTTTSATKDKKLYCICRQVYDPAKPMVGCDKCDEWYHLSCIGWTVHMVAELGDKPFACHVCTGTPLPPKLADGTPSKSPSPSKASTSSLASGSDGPSSSKASSSSHKAKPPSGSGSNASTSNASSNADRTEARSATKASWALLLQHLEGEVIVLPSASQSNRAIIRNNTIECLCNLPSCPKTLPTASAFEKHGGMGYRKNAWDSIVVKRTGQTLRQALAELEVGSTPTATVSKRPPSDPKLAAAAAAKRAKDKEYKRKKQAERSHAAAAKARKVHRDYEHDSDGDHDGDDTDADTATSETDDDERPLETQPLLGIKRKREHPGLSAAQLGQPGAKRQCKMDGCNALARHCSKYCSDECGLVVARQVLIRREDEKTEAQGQLLKQQVDEARKQGPQFHSDIEDFGMLDELAHKLELCFQEMSRIRLQEERLDKAALFASSTIMDVPAKPPSKRARNVEIIDCISCGHPILTGSYPSHMKKCFEKKETRESKPDIDTELVYCNSYNPKTHRYCHKLRASCPFHQLLDYKRNKGQICGCPLDCCPDENGKTGTFYCADVHYCREPRRRCTLHISWESVRRAELLQSMLLTDHAIVALNLELSKIRARILHRRTVTDMREHTVVPSN